MSELTRRAFGKGTLQYGGALSILTVLNFPRAAWAFQTRKDSTFLQRDDLEHALKFLYTTYDSTSPYPHKFNDVLVKYHLVALDFFILKGLEKEYVEHYIETMEPLLRRIGKSVQQDGPEKGLEGMFEDTTCSYQLFEQITVKPGERSFPCPYKEILEVCNKWLRTYSIEWKDICTKWCIPTWSGFAKTMEVKITINTGENCMVKLA
jgi:hypothetical protein